MMRPLPKPKIVFDSSSRRIGLRQVPRRVLSSLIVTFFLVTALFLGAASANASAGKVKTHKVSMIYLNKGGEIWAVRPNGTELHMVARGLDAHISPDGRHIYCKCGKHGGFGVMDPDGSDLKTIGPGHKAFGSSYLYLSGAGTFVTAGSEGGELGGSSVIVGPDSAKSEAETHPVYTARKGATVDIPFFSPDGSKILFLEYDQTTEWANVINSNGSGLHTVAEEPAINGPNSVALESAVFRELIDGLAGFSADGSTVLIYSPETASGPGETGANVWTAAANGGRERELNPLPRGGQGPLLSENGKRIAFSSIAYGSYTQTLGVYTIGVDGSGLRRIVPAAPGEQVTSWGVVVQSVASH